MERMEIKKMANISCTQKVDEKRRRGKLDCDGRTALRQTWKYWDKMYNKSKMKEKHHT